MGVLTKSHDQGRGADSVSGPVGTGEPCAGCSIASESRMTSDARQLQPAGSGPRCSGATAQPTGQNDKTLSPVQPPAGLSPETQSIRKTRGEERIVWGRGSRPLGRARAAGRTAVHLARGHAPHSSSSEAGEWLWISPPCPWVCGMTRRWEGKGGSSLCV